MPQIPSAFRALASLLAGEPVVTVTLIDGLFALAVAAGLPVNIQEKAAVIVIVTAISQLYVRSAVTPNVKIAPPA